MVPIRFLRLAVVAALLLSISGSGILWQAQPVEWSPELEVSASSGDSRIVQVLADPSGAALHLVWEDNRDGSQEVYYKRSLDGGATWGPDVKLSRLTSGTAEPLPKVASNGRNVLVVFSNRTQSGEHLYYALSTDLGSHFPNAKQLTNDPGDQNYPMAAFSGNVAHVVWQGLWAGEKHIYYARSLDGGVNWDSPKPISDALDQDRHPAITALANKVIVVWARDHDGQEAVFLRQSDDYGATWDREVQVSPYQTPVFLNFPAVAYDGESVHVVWNSVVIFYSKSHGSGKVWSRPYSLTNSSLQFLGPQIALAHGEVHVVTSAINVRPAGRNIIVTSDIFYIETRDKGMEWLDPVLLTSHPPRVLSLAPSISTAGGAIFVAWQDNRVGNFAVFFRSMPDFSKIASYKVSILIPTGIVLLSAAAALIVLEGIDRKKFGAVKRRPSGARKRGN